MQPEGNYFHYRLKNGSVWCAVASLLLLALIGCGGSSSSASGTTNDSTTSSTAFPSALAVASPLDWNSGSSPSALARNAMSRTALAGDGASEYSAATELLEDIISGTSLSSCTFDPDLFFQAVTNAQCYGPTVAYVNHPDASPPASGELPPGDTGIWIENDTVTGDACAAAELNARMEGIQARSLGALSGLAAMVCTINTSGGTLSLPDATTASVDLTSALPAPTGVTINSAVLNYTTTTDDEAKYTYSLDFDYNATNIIVELAHIPDAASSNVYRGQLTYRINTTATGTNCSPNPDAPVTRNGSLVYNRTATTAMAVEMREAQFCGADVNGLDADGVVDATNEFDLGSAPHGWGDDFNLFRTEFDPTSLLGNYAYSWQAGHMDGNTRVFNLRVYDDSDDATEDLEATAFFGYGLDARNADPSIHGFIFNWAGPGNNHTLQEYAQKQEVSYNTTSGNFDSMSANILYAPTVSGNYDGLGTFSYDSDADGSVDTNPSAAITHELANPTSDGTELTIEQTISDAGIVVPAQPVCSECVP